MYEMLFAYLLFLMKGVTLVILFLVVMAVVMAMKSKGKEAGINFVFLNEKQYDLEKSLLASFAKTGQKAAGHALKQFIQAGKTRKKMDKKAMGLRKRSFVMSFEGDMHASQVKAFREEISAVLRVAQPEDEVIVRVQSPGGAVPCYGLVASQLVRVKQAKIKLTVCVDQIAASGGYLAAVVADRILAAPFATIGSIGVVVTVPNFHDFLKKQDVDVIELTAGKHKRSISMLGKTTEEGKKHTTGQLKTIHEQFKEMVISYRPQVDIQQVATGDYWTAKTALSYGLVDDLTTSDAYIQELMQSSDVWEVSTPKKKSLQSMLKASTATVADVLWQRFIKSAQTVE